MPILRLRFPGGRYHATPWGHHVNEGQIEWPPSPWRLLRALIAVGFNTQQWSEIPPIGRDLIEKLASTLPSYRLPSASAAHSRHYMPLAVFDKGREKTTLVFDTWADVADGCLDVEWNCSLTDQELELLARLASCLGYLGRSESWVEAKLVGDANSATQDVDGFNAVPHSPTTRLGPGWEQISLMAPMPAEEFQAWRQTAVGKVLSALATPQGKKKPTASMLKERAKAEAPYPVDLEDCLTKDTAWLKKHRWSQPPGAQRVIYWRRTDILGVGAPQRPAARKPLPVTAMLLSLTTPSGRRSALPLVTRTLPQAELLHQAIVGRAGRGGRVHCPELTGRDEHGEPLRHGHQHAHILPFNLRDDASNSARLDHILVYAPMGLGGLAQQAIRDVRETWSKKGVELQVALAGSGDLAMLQSLPPPFDRRIHKMLGPSDGSRIWQSATPFIPPRFLKPRGPNSLLGQVNAELASRGLPPAEGVEVLPAESIAMRHFVHVRQRGGASPPVPTVFALRITLAQPANGPLCIGYASHFGMGRFESVE